MYAQIYETTKNNDEKDIKMICDFQENTKKQQQQNLKK